MSYILVTTVKNEISYLPLIIGNILNQSVLPVIWIIIDDNSTDGSYRLAVELTKEYEWIHIIKKQSYSEAYSHFSFASALKEAHAYARELCKTNKISYGFLGKVDAAVILCDNYFEELIVELQGNPKLAIVCGCQYLKTNKNITKVSTFFNSDLNDIRLYRKEFIELFDFPISYSPDTVLLIKAKLNGVESKLVDRVYFFKLRLGGSKIGLWKGYLLKGNAMYYLGYHPILMILNSLCHGIKFTPHYQCIPMILGYFFDVMKKKQKIEDNQIKKYFWNQRLKEVFLQSMRRKT
jgi:glycosyltransferase involved in cell wall biosynthesis